MLEHFNLGMYLLALVGGIACGVAIGKSLAEKRHTKLVDEFLTEFFLTQSSHLREIIDLRKQLASLNMRRDVKTGRFVSKK